ncbi:MAG: tRNA 2-thiouridine(34) synthase MnmA [Gammaproteobacteria bacterium]|nr:tRNA 2-thiouridine(34) synthase MnmA [Gammaproteobacteria bacterium]
MTPSFVIVGLSGGVDSSVAAYLLKKAGHHVEAVFMKNWEEDDTEDFCPAAADYKDAQAVSDLLGIELHCVNFAAEYWQSVFDDFLREHQAFRTPNPDVLCNKEIKFKAFLDYAKNRGADYIATGHYARLEKVGDVTRLLKGLDADKDQSYFLHAVQHTQLRQSLFPLGHLQKSEVRAMAKSLGLVTATKKDSTGICFIGERKFKSFLQDFMQEQPGSIETLEGEVIGQHQGLMFYTVGQRQGLNIGGMKGKIEAAWYVAHKDIKRNVLQVVQGEAHPALFKASLTVQSIHWINHPPEPTLPLSAKIRYRQTDQPCQIEPLPSGHFKVNFHQKQRAVTPGQSVVFYQDDICLGGGIIES